MKRIILFLFNLFFIVCMAHKPLKYDITSAGIGTYGNYLIKVYVYSKSPKVLEDDIKYAAVHGIIFRGFAGQTPQKPLAASPTIEQEKKDYFDTFFGKEGFYMQFASILPGSYERIKVEKQYKIGAIVQVNKDNLRKELESCGIIKGLSSGF